MFPKQIQFECSTLNVVVIDFEAYLSIENICNVVQLDKAKLDEFFVKLPFLNEEKAIIRGENYIKAQRWIALVINIGIRPDIAEKLHELIYQELMVKPTENAKRLVSGLHQPSLN